MIPGISMEFKQFLVGIKGAESKIKHLGGEQNIRSCSMIQNPEAFVPHKKNWDKFWGFSNSSDAALATFCWEDCGILGIKVNFSGTGSGVEGGAGGELCPCQSSARNKWNFMPLAAEYFPDPWALPRHHPWSMETSQTPSLIHGLLRVHEARNHRTLRILGCQSIPRGS